MTGRTSPELADRLALELLEHGPLPLERLARLVARRTADVRAVLRADPRFERRGQGRGSSWTLASSAWDGLGRILSGGSGSSVEARLAAIEQRLTAIEQRLALEPDRAAGAVAPAGQLTVDEALAATSGADAT